MHQQVLRLVQYNVCGFKQGLGAGVVRGIAKSLAPLRPDFVALNEVDRSNNGASLELLAAALDIKHVAFFGHAFRGNYGNALLSRYPIESRDTYHLNGGTRIVHRNKQGITSTKRIVRGLLMCTVRLGETANSPSIRIAVTHLDHMNPNERQTQISHILDILGEDTSQATIVVGDLNALDREDYTDAEWLAKESRFKERGWNGPFDCAKQGRVLHSLKTRGFNDCFALSSPQRVDAMTNVGMSEAKHLKAELPSTRARTTPVEDPTMRIDYVFANRPFLDLLQPTNPQVLTWVTESDHFPISIDFSQQKQQLKDSKL